MAKLVGGGGWGVCCPEAFWLWVSFNPTKMATPTSNKTSTAPVAITYTLGTRRDRCVKATLSSTGAVRSSPETPNGMFQSYTAFAGRTALWTASILFGGCRFRCRAARTVFAGQGGGGWW